MRGFEHEVRAVKATEDACDGERQTEARPDPVKETSDEDEEACGPFVLQDRERLRSGRSRRPKEREYPPPRPEITQGFEQTERKDCDCELFQVGILLIAGVSDRGGREPAPPRSDSRTSAQRKSWVRIPEHDAHSQRK
jgi:hypothetical protein